jgi:predicted SprT family Zn-dependent metalloprotease
MCYNYSIEKKKVFSFKEIIMTADETYKLCIKCRDELIALGYDVPDVVFTTNYNSVSIMGVCVKVANKFTIKISKFHWQNNGPEEVRNTIIHELSHAIDRNKHSHNYQWMRLAGEISAKTNTVIKMYAKSTEGEVKAAMDKAVAYTNCESCGNRHYIYRRTKVYKVQGSGFYCSICGPDSKITFVKLK